jgi:hypothetical protein
MACGSQAATIAVTTGGETDTLTEDPAVTSVAINAVDESGNSVMLGQGTLPATTSIDLGSQSQEEVVSIQLTGTSSTGPVVFGATPFAELGALSGLTIPLFIQRKGQLARMPGALPDGRAAPLLAVTDRAVYVVGGTISGTQGDPPIAAYDLLLLNQLQDTWAPPQTATSFALVQLAQEDADGDLALGVFIDAKSASVIGLATQTLECSDDPTISPTACTKTGTITWSDVAGGATVMDLDSIAQGLPPAAYVIGASSPASASSTIAALPPTIFGGGGVMQMGSTSLRQGAAVAWAPNRGVFIYGGTGDSKYTGAEDLSSSLALTSLGYPADPAAGLAAVAFDANTMLIAGNAAGSSDALVPYLVDLTCTSMCALVPWGMPLPYALSSPSLFSIGTSTSPAFIIVGDDATGATHVFELTASAAPQEILLKIARQGARAIQTQTGAIVIVGGGSPTPESFVP